MGIPSFFSHLLKNKHYKNIHSGIKNNNQDTNINNDYFFLDYNGIVYKAYDKVKKTIEGKNLSKTKIEELIIEEVIRYTKYLICEIVKPKKMTYISFDGPAPRAKMIQQRSRRYKGYSEKMFLQNEKKKYGILKDEIEWDRSANISPGTEFMQKLGEELIKIIDVKGFSDHNPKMEFILNDSNIPGEGEHKFLSFIHSMKTKKTQINSKICIYGGDADLFVLSISTHKNNINILREIQLEIPEIKEMYQDYEFVMVNIDQLRNAFYNDLTYNFKNVSFDKEKILNDYIFLTFLVGNDFVISLPFLKINKDGLKTLIKIYHDIKINHSNYLVIYNSNEQDPPKINVTFLKELITEMSKREDSLMKMHYRRNIQSLIRGYKNPRRIESELKMTPYEKVSSRYTHLEVCSPDHPLFNKYRKEFNKIDYNLDYEVWKEQYYKYYLNIDKNNEEEYLNVRMELIENYLESLVFTLKYYFQGCPSWTWKYKFRISPLLSDILYGLDKIDINKIVFKKDKPYTPFQQLMLILPPQMNILVPPILRPIMIDDKLMCTQFYPTDINMDVTIGLKTMYSEAILPEIDEELLIPIIKKFEKKLNEDEKKRNMIKTKYYYMK